ncbi:hypothetical protein D3C76_36780 [compost metagenome]
MPQIDKRTLKFFIGAATTGEGEGKWSWPGRDLQYLYQREWNGNSRCSIEPSVDVWKQYGCVVVAVMGQGLRLMKFQEFFDHFGEQETLDMLTQSRGTYLKESKDEILDTLGCPR